MVQSSFMCILTIIKKKKKSDQNAECTILVSKFLAAIKLPVSVAQQGPQGCISASSRDVEEGGQSKLGKEVESTGSGLIDGHSTISLPPTENMCN